MELGNELISRRGELIFARKREFCWEGCFSRFGGAFSRFGGYIILVFWGGVFVFWGVFSRRVAIYFARSPQRTVCDGQTKRNGISRELPGLSGDTHRKDRRLLLYGPRDR